jgi:hypothetical protein
LANFLVASFLWIRGNWFFYIGQLRVKLYLWPILKSSLILAFLVYAAVHYRKILPLLRSLWADVRSRLFALGFMAGYSPAIYGSLTGKSPSSPGGLIALPNIVRNVFLAIPEMISRLAGASRIMPLQVLSIAIVVFGFLVLGRLLWRQTRMRLQVGTAVKPFYAILALCITAAGFGLAGTNLRDAGTMRFLVPLFLCLPAGIALGLKEIKKKSRLLAWGILCAFLGNTLWSNVLVWRNHAYPSRYETIAQSLAKERVKGGYADYWSAYYLTFLTREEIILAPKSGKERYAPYPNYVQSLEEIVLVGESISPGQHRLEIKGTGYEVIRAEVWEGLPVTFLKKIAP